MRRSRRSFAFQSACNCLRALGGRLALRRRAVSQFIGALRTFASFFGDLAFFRCRQIDTRATRFGETYRNCLLCGSRSMLSLANILNLLADELARLRRWRLSFPFSFSSSFNRRFSWHG